MISKFTHLLRLGFLALCALIAVWSCSKIDDLPLEEPISDTVAFLHKEFNKKAIEFETKSEVVDKNYRQSLERILSWDKAVSDSSGYFIPIKYQVPEGFETVNGDQYLDIRAFLKISRNSDTDKPKYELLNLFPDEGDFEKFSGVILSEGYFEGRVTYNFYKEGKSLSRNQIIARTKKPSSGNRGMVASGSNCYRYKVGSVCVGEMPGGSSGDVCVDHYETACVGGGGDGGEDAPIDYEVVGPDAGGGGSNPTNSQVYKMELITKKLESPCDGVKLANKYFSSQSIISAVNQLKGLSNESAIPLNLSNRTNFNSLTLGKTNTSNSSNHVSINSFWDASNGYTVGYLHNHPAGSAPSPSDIFVPANNLQTMINSKNVIGVEFETYINNYASLVVSNGYIYTITIKNGAYFKAMQDNGHFEPGFDRKATNIEYSNNLTEYLMRNRLDVNNPSHYQEAGEYSLMKMYGDIINLSKQKVGDPTGAKSINISNKKVKSENPC